MINEDKLILTSMKNWTFLKDGTGNIIDQSNIDFLIEEVNRKFVSSTGTQMPVNLVTADGSIDCQSCPMDQENAVARLQLAEIITALSILSVGGSFVLKIFTFFEIQTVSHLYLLSSLFKEVRHDHKNPMWYITVN
jgi:cap2 methyltransferase